MPAGPQTILLDNGSLEPAATLALRDLAARLSSQLGLAVEPVSLLHSSAVAAEKLGGLPAEILMPALERRLASGQNDFVIVPLFFGPSRALTEYLPEQLAKLREKHPTLQARLAPPLHAAGDDRLARILADNVSALLTADGSLASSLPRGAAVRVALVDHGSPVAAVTAVRDELARQLALLLGPRVAAVAPCSMERRPEPAYDFNDPLLAKLLVTPAWAESRVIVALQFLSPGRHAGPTGDVAKICAAAEASHPKLKTQITGLVGTHPLLLGVLADRWRAAAVVAPA